MGEKNAEISARIAETIKRVGENPSSFAKCLGYSRAQTIYDILNGKSAPSYDFFNRFANAEISALINLQWLLTGKGDMLKTKSIQTQQTCDSCSILDNKDSENLSLSQTFIADIIDKFLATIKDKDKKLSGQAEKIAEQAAEIGRLQEQIRQMKIEKREAASDVSTSGSANAG